MLAAAERHRAGIASATFTTVRPIGDALGLAVFGASIAGIPCVFVVCACASALACIVSLIGIGRPDGAVKPA
ncbi:hypothetical protein GQ56_0106660 [Burkholderia paludis]|nr:hypothetical protein GQ56_0106660 [Burkholderia paludis]